jgi:hypothetical protein
VPSKLSNEVKVCAGAVITITAQNKSIAPALRMLIAIPKTRIVLITLLLA